MPLNLLAEVGGQVVPLADCDWVMYAPCGCPAGVTLARLAVTEDDAWKAFHARKRDADRAQRQGYRMELVTRARWSEAHAVRHLDAARNEMSEARDWLNSETGGPFPDVAADGRREVLRVVGEAKGLIDQAKGALRG